MTVAQHNPIVDVAAGLRPNVFVWVIAVLGHSRNVVANCNFILELNVTVRQNVLERWLPYAAPIKNAIAKCKPIDDATAKLGPTVS